MLKSGKDVHILIVDDVSENIQVAMNILKEESYTFSFASDGQEALDLIANNAFDLILLDIMMPKINGYDVCLQIKQLDHVKDTPVIFLTAKADVDAISKGFQVGGVDYIVKPFHANELLCRVKTHIELAISRQALKTHSNEVEVKANLQASRLTKEIEDNQCEMIYILMEVMESTSDETGQHIKRVADICKLLAQKVDYLSEEEVTSIFLASPMHDIGKIAIPEDILHKPGKLTDDEMAIMKTHAEKGYELLKNSKRRLTTAAAIIAHEHHEKWDGSGYPRGLKGDEIHIYGRIVALADVFDALTHKRQYKSAWTVDDAVEYIKQNSGKHFDPALVDILITNLSEFLEIMNQ
ncbi:HD domain-containing phosphohydrolase [uncultured Paraglaciecola sp.]|uniref:HD domain-containing phosphohydrolase n=1 Tax=uncultured Paraglaciecola sp. TaxID=1765024 RepID=UPI002591796D|nr:HD domain-containing phosphohydrolase [uncultured Paraglaciecola sp.]